MPYKLETSEEQKKKNAEAMVYLGSGSVAIAEVKSGHLYDSARTEIERVYADAGFIAPTEHLERTDSKGLATVLNLFAKRFNTYLETATLKNMVDFANKYGGSKISDKVYATLGIAPETTLKSLQEKQEELDKQIKALEEGEKTVENTQKYKRLVGEFQVVAVDAKTIREEVLGSFFSRRRAELETTRASDLEKRLNGN